MINTGQKTVYIEPFSNLTLQPEIDIYLLKNLKKTFLQSPGFTLVSNKTEAHIIIHGRIQQFSRNPEFVSESDQIVMASYKVKIALQIERNGNTMQKEIDQIYFLELSDKLKTDLLLDNITKKISQDIYFNCIETDEK